MTTQHNAKPQVSQKLLAIAALAMAAAFAFAPADRTPQQGETVFAADSSRSLAAR